jgi:hypothetical protein
LTTSGRVKALSYLAVLGCLTVLAAGSASQGAQPPTHRVPGIVPPKNRIIATAARAASTTPVHGVVGQPIAVKGNEFAKVSDVALNITAADSFTLKGNRLSAVVAPGTTSGPVHLTWFGGTVNGPAFTVDPSPGRRSSPSSRPALTLVRR